MNDIIPHLRQYFPYLIAYVAFYLIAYRLMEYLETLSKNCRNSQKYLYEKFQDNQMKQAQNSWNAYKERVSKIGQERSYHTNLTVISIILIIVNAFILSAFLESIGNLSSPIIIEPFRINYSHLIAAAIVIVEIATGILYYIGHTNQQANEDNPIYAMLKFFAIIAFVALMAVETIMWARLSVLFDMPELLGLSQNNVFRDAIDYFLGALGIGFTLSEFAIGYFLTKYSQYGKDSFITNFARYFIVSLLFIFIYYIPSIVLVPITYMCIILLQIIKLLVIPGDAISEKF